MEKDIFFLSISITGLILSIILISQSSSIIEYLTAVFLTFINTWASINNALRICEYIKS